MPYTSGANLGGWLVQENWLLPNVLLLRLGPADIRDNQEWDYIQRMCQRGINAVGSMQKHWGSYLADDDHYDLLAATEPPPLLRRLKAAGVTRLRIPVGYWTFEQPVIDGCSLKAFEPAGPSGRPDELSGHASAQDNPSTTTRIFAGDEATGVSQSDRSGDPWSSGPVLRSLSTSGLTNDGFVTGSAPYLAALLRFLKIMEMDCVIDMHSLPGGAVKHMGYTGRYFETAEAFDGADEWYEDILRQGKQSDDQHGGDSKLNQDEHGPLPSMTHPYLYRSVAALDALAALVAELDACPETAGVVAAISPWNEALFSDDVKAAALLPAFTLAMTLIYIYIYKCHCF